MTDADRLRTLHQALATIARGKDGLNTAPLSGERAKQMLAKETA